MRVVNRILALLVGLALAAAGGLALAETAAAFSGRPPLVVPRDEWAAALSTHSWSDGPLQTAAVLLIVVGVLLLLVQLIPRTPIAYQLEGDGEDREISVDRRGLQERVRRVVLKDADVVDASVKLSKKKAQVRAALLPDADRNETQSRLNDALTSEFTKIRLRRPLRPAITAMQAQERVR